MKQNNDNRTDGKLDATDVSIADKSPFFKWLDNFWYHYKWTFLIVVFFAVVVIICVVQMIGKTEPDNTLVLAGPIQLTNEQVAAINTDLTSLLDEDKNGDGQKVVNLLTFSVYSEDELNQANTSETDENGKFVTNVSSSYNSSVFNEYTEYTGSGDCSVYLVSEFLYDNLKGDGNRLRPLSELFGDELPAGALSDGYGIRLGDTDLYKFFDSLKCLPEDTVICLMRPFALWGESSNDDSYSASVEHFKNIANFKIQ